MSFGDDVEQAHAPLPLVWRLMLFDVPDGMGGLVTRLGFRPTRKNHRNWWRVFDPAETDAHAAAQEVRGKILSAGLRGSWQQVARSLNSPTALKPRRAPTKKQFQKHKPTRSRDGFGGRLNATPISGTWRVKRRRR